MGKWNKGDRVGAILGANDDTVKVLGFGVYDGEEVPPADASGFGSILHELGQTNPKLVLDNGDVVWGCECWWGTEEGVKARIADYKNVEHVTIAQARKESEGDSA